MKVSNGSGELPFSCKFMHLSPECPRLSTNLPLGYDLSRTVFPRAGTRYQAMALIYSRSLSDFTFVVR